MKSRIHLVFVHGFNSDKSTWNELWRQLSHGAFPRAELVPHWFEYNSKLVELNFSNAIPKLDEIREAVAHHMYEEEGTWYPDLAETAPSADQQMMHRDYNEAFDRFVGEDAGLQPA